MRGGRTSGKGHKRKTKGAGRRGGRGLAGTGKRADQKKPSIWKDTEYFGRHGFINHSRKKIKCLNIAELNGLVIMFNNGKFKEKIVFDNDTYTIDLAKMGYDKLLGKGKAEYKFKVIVDSITACAKSKVISE